MNYVDDDYVMDELDNIHKKGNDIDVDWLTGSFMPEILVTPRIQKSIGHYRDRLAQHLASHNVDLSALSLFVFSWPARGRKFMVAIDNRGKNYKIYVNESK
jgi:hypothetical protein